ncbi:MAG: hypothetical protein AABY04_03110, partial [Candidatus Micrarchaeota archaeon]
EYGAGSIFEEARNFTIGADDRHYIHDIFISYNVSANITGTPFNPIAWEPLVLCNNTPYNLTVQMSNGITVADADNLTLQVSSGGPYSALPSSSWQLLDVFNSRNVSFTASSSGTLFGANSTSWMIRPIVAGSYNLRTFMVLRNSAVLFSSNIQAVTVRDCSNVALANRDISIKGPDGTNDQLMRGSIGYIAIPLYNYNETNAITATATLSVLVGSTNQNWYSEEGALQSASFNYSNYTNTISPAFNETVFLWRVHVPDNADTGSTYTASIDVTRNGQTATYTRNFLLSENPVQIFTASPEYTDSTNEDATERMNMSMVVCNYGDKAITDGTLTLEFPSIYYAFEYALPRNSTSENLNLIWQNVNIQTSSCFWTQTSFRPIDTTGLDLDFITTLAWDSNTKATSETRTISQPSTQDQPYPYLQISKDSLTYESNLTLDQNSSNNNIYMRFRWMGDTAGTGNTVHNINQIEIPQGFQIPFNLSGVNPHPGYPLGSEKEGWKIKSGRWGALAEANIKFVNFTLNVSATPDYQPGGKRLFLKTRGASVREGAATAPIRYKMDDQRFALVVMGPFLKTNRTYATNTAGPMIDGFPSSFACGTYNVSEVIFNKGNRIGYMYNFTEFFPSTISPQFYSVTPTLTGSDFARWGIAYNLTANGTRDIRAFNYSFSTPLGALYNQRFQFNATNGTYFAQTPGRLYLANFSCTDTPQYQNVSVTPASSGFGFLKMFSVAVYSLFHNLSVNLSKSPDGLVNWTVLNTTNVTSNGVWNYANFSQSWACTDIGSWYYNFTIFDTDGNANTTTVSLGTTYTITKDTLQINLISGNASLANRSSSKNDLLRVLVNDTNGTYIGSFSLNFSVTYDGTNYGPATLNATNSTGYLDYNFNATCNQSNTQYASRPDQSWKVTLAGSSCYFDISSAIYALQVKGFLTNNVTNPSGSTNFTDPVEINAQGNVKDDCGNFISPVEDSTISTTFNFTANNSNRVCSGSSLGGGFFECPWASTEDKVGGYYNVTMNSTATKYYGDFKTKVGPDSAYLFYLNAKPKISAPFVIPSSDGWGVPVNYTVNYSSSVWNINTTARLQLRCPSCTPAVPLFEVTPASFCVGCLNKTALWTYNYSCAAGNSQVGTWFYTFSANTSEGLSQSLAENSTTIEKDDLAMFLIRGNNSIVNRSDGQTVRFTLNITDTDRGTYAGTPAATVTFNVSTNTSNNLTAGTNTTNTTGSVDFYFNATCDHAPGNQSWY